MKIKSLLLGSAAALVAVSGARAADAVVIPEPEAVEYVRVCDAAGSGYFYIPGSETCLKISGYVRYEISGDDESDGWNKDTEARILFNSWTDSEFGAVTTNIRIDGNIANDTGDPATQERAVNTDFDRAYLTVGGLNMGLDTNLYDFDEDGAADDLTANGEDRNQISYTADFGSGSFALQVVDDDNLNYTPNVIAQAAYSFGDLSVTAAVGYDDQNFIDHDGLATTDDIDSGSSWGAKIAASYSGFGAHVAYSSEPALGGDYSAGHDWVIGANYGFDATEKLNINLAGVVGLESADYGDTDYTLGVEASYALTSTFEISSRVRYHSDVDAGAIVGSNVGPDGIAGNADDAPVYVAAGDDDDEGWDWRVRFTSSF